jgi:threonyl-tRNA synthetase
VTDKLKAAGLRVEANLGSEKIGAKIRTATLEKVPYMLVLGEKEQQAGMVAVRHRTEGDKGQVSVEAFIEKAKGEIASKALVGPIQA